MRTFTNPVALRRRTNRPQADGQDLLWRKLQGGRLGGFKFARQCPVGAHFVQFACHARRIVVEIENPDILRDHARDAALMAEGYAVFRVSAQLLQDDDEAICLSILAVLEDRWEDFMEPPPRAVRKPAPFSARARLL